MAGADGGRRRGRDAEEVMMGGGGGITEEQTFCTGDKAENKVNIRTRFSDSTTSKETGRLLVPVGAGVMGGGVSEAGRGDRESSTVERDTHRCYIPEQCVSACVRVCISPGSQ